MSDIFINIYSFMCKRDIFSKKLRIRILDYLRGLMTLAIMSYHLISWRINPINSNNFFLYNSGIFIYYNLKNIKFNKLIYKVLLAISTVLFVFAPFYGDQINIVTGFPRIFFVILCLIIVICFYKLEVNVTRFIRKPLETFGLVTYGVYILHPILNSYLATILIRIGIMNVYMQIFFIVAVTIVVSLISYYYFESKFINIGKKITDVSTIKYKGENVKI